MVICAGSYLHLPSPGSSRVKVMIKNITANSITVNKGEEVALIKPANAIPDMLAPKLDESNWETIPKLAPQVNILDGGTQVNHSEHTHESISEPTLDRTPLAPEKLQKLFEKLNIKSNMQDWDPEQKTRAHEIIKQYSFLFAMDSLDFAKTDLVKHHIALTDYTPIKDRY